MDVLARYIIAEISDKDFDPNFASPINFDDYYIRKASRGVLIHDGKLALLYVSKENYHKLPGGGIEAGESNEEAFICEIREETGCDCKIVDEKGQNSVVLESRNKIKLFQISYIFFAEVVGEPKEMQLTQDEIKDGFQLKWVPVIQAYETLQKDSPVSYEGNFIQKRDMAVVNFFGKKF